MKSGGIWEDSGSCAVFQDHMLYQKLNHVFGFYQAALEHKSSSTYAASLGRANEQTLWAPQELCFPLNPPAEKPHLWMQ